ncbi:hypothetical protein KSS87_014719, partial [Heliosperma pusillum]
MQQWVMKQGRLIVHTRIYNDLCNMHA